MTKKKKKPVGVKGKTTIREDVTSIIGKAKKPITTRQLLDAINKKRKPQNRVTVYGVRRIVGILGDDGTIVVTRKGKSILIKKGKVKK